MDYDGVAEIARRIRAVVGQLDQTPLHAPDPADVGHARLTDALGHFASKWNPAVEQAHTSADHLAANIVHSAQVYDTTDHNVAGTAGAAASEARPR